MKKFALFLFVFFLNALSARADSIVSSLPFNLTNGSTADATQVMANFNAIVSGVNTNAAANGNNSSITNLTGLTGVLSASGYSVNGATVPSSGIYLPSSNMLGFSAGGNAAGTFDDSGNFSSVADINVGADLFVVGSAAIGTSSALYPLDVRGPAGATIVSNGSPVFNQIVVQTFCASGCTTTCSPTCTYTPTPGMQSAVVLITGAGGSSSTITSGNAASSGGGASAAYAKVIETAVQIGTSQSISIGTSGAVGGAGAATTFGSLITAPGGGAGVACNCGSSVGGAGGTGSSPVVNTGTVLEAIVGQNGEIGGSGSVNSGGAGGSNPLGLGGQETICFENGIAGNTGTGFGSGAGGGCANATGYSTGIQGQPGRISIIENISN